MISHTIACTLSIYLVEYWKLAVRKHSPQTDFSNLMTFLILAYHLGSDICFISCTSQTYIILVICSCYLINKIFHLCIKRKLMWCPVLDRLQTSRIN